MKITKHIHHNHYWIEDGRLYESYNTLRGLRYCYIMDVPLPDNDDVSEETILYIETNYLMFQ